MHRFPRYFGGFLWLVVAAAVEAMPSQPNTFVFDGVALLDLKQRIANGQTRGDELKSYGHLIKRANKNMKNGPYSVMTKPTTPPSGDKHDYESLATYYWPCNNATFTPAPNCNQTLKPSCDLTTCLPWIGRDGHRNPCGDNFDKVPMDDMISTVQILSAAYFFSGNESYAERAVLLLRTWFLDASTAMNPNLNFSSIRPGIDNGSSSGVIDIHDLYIVVESVGLIGDSDAWRTDDQSRLKTTWFREMLRWLIDTPFGKDANMKPNNHGTWSDVVRSSFALFSDDTVTAKEIAEKVISNRIMTQIEPNGQMPYEDNRTNAASYSCMNMRALFNLARLASFSGVELFNYTSKDGRGIRQAFEYLVPFAVGKQPWPFKEINENFSWGKMIDLFRRAANAYQYPPYEEMIGQLPSSDVDATGVGLPDEDDKYLTDMLFPKQFY